MRNNFTQISSISSKQILKDISNQLIDDYASKLCAQVQWISLDGLSNNNVEEYPIAICGKGPPILCLHGFDSCFLEFRRLYPLLEKNYKLIIPDLFGFGFCPRPEETDYGLNPLVNHLNAILDKFSKESPISIIGASMGGAIAMELSRRNNKKISKLLLLSPAGLIGKTNKIPWPLNYIGVNFLGQPFVRKALCKQAFANPQASVGPAEEQIASIHLSAPGWRRSLASFARNGGVGNCGTPLPSQPFKILMGDKDRIIPKNEKKNIYEIMKGSSIEIKNCGHLPHLDQPKIVAKIWNDFHKEHE